MKMHKFWTDTTSPCGEISMQARMESAAEGRHTCEIRDEVEAGIGDPVGIWYVQGVQLSQPGEAAQDPVSHTHLQRHPYGFVLSLCSPSHPILLGALAGHLHKAHADIHSSVLIQQSKCSPL